MSSRFTLVVGLLACLGCGLGENAVEDGATGVSRLAVVSAAALTAALIEDDNCGFGSEAVRDAAVVSGRPGEEGRVTYTVVNCEIAGAELVDCEDAKTQLSGSITVTATLTIEGRVTGDAEEPVLPLRTDATSLVVSTAIVDRFAVTVPGAPATMTLVEGTLRFRASPLLAVSDETGYCTVPIGDLSLHDVNLDEVNAFISSDDGDGYVYVRSSDLDANVGLGISGENDYRGVIELVTGSVRVPIDGEQALDPDYDRASALRTFSCEDDLAMPLDTSCAELASQDEELALGIARSSVTALAAIASLVTDDANCGFDSPDARASLRLSGAPGELGTATMRVEACVIDLPTPRVITEDCNGDVLRANGRVEVTAVQVQTGMLTGTATSPVLPLTAVPARVRVESARLVSFGLEVDTASASAASTVSFLDGTLSGSLAPRFAQSADIEACTFQTPHTRFEGVALERARVGVTQDGRAITAQVSTSSISATAGRFGGSENELLAMIEMNGSSRMLADRLDPDYSQNRFEAGFACETELEKPVNFSCDPRGGIADAVARLTPVAFGAIVQALESDTECGFSSANVSVQANGPVGDDASVTFSLPANCELTFSLPTSVNTDCDGVELGVQGVVRATGTRRVRGFVTGDPTLPVVPTVRDATTYDLQLDFRDFRVFGSDRVGALRIVDGQLAGRAVVRGALDTTTNACSLPTPVLRLENLAYSSATVRITDDTATAGLRITSSDISATTGRANALSGTITTTRTYAVPSDGDGLDPSFDAGAFDRSFACTPNLRVADDDAACAFRAPLAPAVAALLVQDLAAAGALVSGDQACGFRSQRTVPLNAVPPRPTGVPPDLGLVTDAVRECAIAPMGPIAEDCFRLPTIASGFFVVTATRTTQGVRMEQCMGPFCLQFAVPVSRDAIRTEVSITPTAFSAAAGDVAGNVTRSLVLDGGRASFVLTPILGESLSTPGVFTVQTPVARLSGVRVQGAQLRLRVDGRQFNLMLDDATLEARIGFYEGTGNRVMGSVRLDGQTIPLDLPLDPSYSQTQFDRSYDCVPDLAGAVPSN